MKGKMMRWIGGTLFALICSATVSAQEVKASLAAGETGKIYFKSANRNTGIEALYKKKVKYDETIFGELVIPEAAGKVPAMVIMHGSGGVDGGTSRAWASFFNQLGIATFIVDSFTPRDIKGTGADQTQITYTTSGIDGLRALQLLATHPRIDASRIGQIGFSRGGVATQEASFEKFRAAVIPDALKFALHIPLYGGCIQYGTTTDSPILSVFGEDDGTVKMDQCRRSTELMRARGANIKLVTYPGALHGFDRDNQKRNYIADLQTWKDCQYGTDMDTLVTQTPNSTNASVAEVVEYRKTCMTRGVMYGGDYSATQKVRQEVKNFIAQQFGL